MNDRIFSKMETRQKRNRLTLAIFEADEISNKFKTSEAKMNDRIFSKMEIRLK